ncbi:winged helix DNA-binding domain-containing protein [Bdellovibrio sp. ArHS]|uniref:winged helix-turn-helix domain-containing protein n=1 Tax=Bdellovibrio sp. ArHS TaxID=1569284 RepID=UPI000B177797|nr:winged helix DNA-binding domain-containing protein [Bdellovibrio sp. ArHS]
MKLTQARARHLWIHAQRLDEVSPFGSGPQATVDAIDHLGYVQIDTIHVIERCHHHILYSRIPKYHKQDLHTAQTLNKEVFEYWTHALAYIPTKDFRFFMNDMKRRRLQPSRWYQSVKKTDLQKVLRLIKNEGALSIRDIEDDVLVEKDHPWVSRKPSKKALDLAFNGGLITVSERLGMLKKYDLVDRHFDWEKKPKAATTKEVFNYLLDRALRSQAFVSLDSICHLYPSRKPEIHRLIEQRVRKKELVEIQIDGISKYQTWIRPEELEKELKPRPLTHILSPFDPLIIQRKRLQAIFAYEHRFEAYIPKEKRVYGYFALPVLVDDEIVAALDLKTDRQQQKVLIQKWTWLGKHKSRNNKRRIEEELHRFEKFQLAKEEGHFGAGLSKAPQVRK